MNITPIASHHDLIIVGSGPAGYTAGLYAARSGLNPVVFAGAQPGGQLTITTEVENFPGFSQGILGPELMDQLRRQAERFGADVRFESIVQVDFSDRPYRVLSDSGAWHEANAVIVATGASANWLGLKSEIEFGGFGVSACATCDGFFFRNRIVAVVGGGDTALEEAQYLTRHASKVYIVHRRDSFRGSKIMQDRVMANPKVEVIWNASVREIVGADTPHKHVKALRLSKTDSGAEFDLPVDGVFVAIGHRPNSDIFKNWLALDRHGYVSVFDGTTSTNLEGIFAAGDVVDSHYRQAVTAAGTGCMAAIDAERYLAAASFRSFAAVGK